VAGTCNDRRHGTYGTLSSYHHNGGLLGVCQAVELAKLDTSADSNSTSVIVPWTSVFFCEFNVFEAVDVHDQRPIAS